MCRIFRAYNRTGQVVLPRTKPKKLSDEQIGTIRGWLEEDCTMTLKEIQTRAAIVLGTKVSIETIRKCIRSFNFTLKRVQLVAQAADTDEIWQQRREFSLWFCRTNVRNGKVIFIDESGFQLTHRRNHGRSKVGTRPVLIVPRIKSTVMASMSSIGVEHFKVLESNGNTVNFLAFLRELFQRLANSRRENCILVVDNVSIKSKR
jgi:hypothetical protein